jgi:hypothetical protein
MTCGVIFHCISSHQMFSCLWYGAYDNLVASSVDLKRFNLLDSSSSSRADMSSLGCMINFSRYLVLKLVISALTVGICRSVWKIVFGTYHGALTVDLRISFWNICSISMFELLAVPQRVMPYVQMGFRIVLYIFLDRRYNSLRVLIRSKIVLHKFLSNTLLFQFLIFIFCRSILTSSFHLFFGLPFGLEASGFHYRFLWLLFHLAFFPRGLQGGKGVKARCKGWGTYGQ